MRVDLRLRQRHRERVACGLPIVCGRERGRATTVSAVSGTPFVVAHVRGRASQTARFVRGTIHPARLLFYTF